MKTRISSSFRSTLKQEIPSWLQEGIVTEDAAQRLNERYQLDAVKQESSWLLAAVIFTLGGLLLGGGVISFVAANWEDIPTLAKVVLLLAVMLAFHLVGYWLWHTKGSSRLGHALVFTGSLVFGANIGLMAQIFHVSGEWYGAFGAWALGALVMAYAARSWLTGLLALVTTVVWYGGIVNNHQQFWLALIPLCIAAAFLPLAWMLRSRVLSVATFAGLTLALGFVTAERYGSGKYVVVALVTGGFAAWATGEFHRLRKFIAELGNPTAGAGILILGLSAYIWSFHELWEVRSWMTDATTSSPGYRWLLPALVVLVMGLALVLLVVREISAESARRLLAVGMALASIILIVCGMVGAAQRGNVVLLTISANLAALIIAAVAIAIGVMDERRIAFWAGTLFLVLLIISRFLEYETSLLVKSAAFMICGMTMIAAGVAYEKYLRREEVQQ